MLNTFLTLIDKSLSKHLYTQKNLNTLKETWLFAKSSNKNTKEKVIQKYNYNYSIHQKHLQKMK